MTFSVEIANSITRDYGVSDESLGLSLQAFGPYPHGNTDDFPQDGRKSQ
jgi:hypothetical protein